MLHCKSNTITSKILLLQGGTALFTIILINSICNKAFLNIPWTPRINKH